MTEQAVQRRLADHPRALRTGNRILAAESRCRHVHHRGRAARRQVLLRLARVIRSGTLRGGGWCVVGDQEGARER